MIAIDTSALARFFDGIVDATTERVAEALRQHRAYLPPVVVTELLSNLNLREDARELVLTLPRLAIKADYWERTGNLRADLLAQVRKAAVADCLIAQSCIDHDIPLITYDRDFRHFERAGLKLA